MGDDKKEPVCPHCNKTMEPIKFAGYYDEFDCWVCGCEDLKDARVVRGNYN